MNIDPTAATIMAIKFPMKAREGTTILTGYMGTVQYRLEHFVYEEYDLVPHDITGVFHAQRVDVNSNEEVECTVKVRMQLNPALFGGHVTYFEPHHRLSKYDIKEECRALRDCVFSGRTPQFLDCASEVQDHTGVFPGGYLHVLATRKLPGVPISQLLLQGEVWSLTEDDLQGIKQDLVTTINYIRSVGYTLSSEGTTLTLNTANQLIVTETPLDIDTNHIWYDHASGTVYFFDLSRFRAGGGPCRPYYGGSSSSRPRSEEGLTSSAFWKELVAARAARIARVATKRSFRLCLRSRVAAGKAPMRNNNDGWQMVDDE